MLQYILSLYSGKCLKVIIALGGQAQEKTESSQYNAPSDLVNKPPLCADLHRAVCSNTNSSCYDEVLVSKGQMLVDHSFIFVFIPLFVAQCGSF